jgi:hypothetical protein
MGTAGFRFILTDTDSRHNQRSLRSGIPFLAEWRWEAVLGGYE